MIRDLETAWKQADLAVSILPAVSGRIPVRVGRKDLAPAFSAAVQALRARGCRICADRTSACWSVFGFSESGSICVDLLADEECRPSIRRRVLGRSAPSIALLGPDGVGKSTTLRLVREWFEREAPFVNITLRQWRPALLPPLASLLGKGGDGGGDQRPRRNPGNLQWIRLFYYFLDFLVGTWWKDRDRGDNARLIVYDRCALDMTVDPYRFALKSRHGTRLLWNITPRPRMLVLLYDTARRIAQRKDDLREHEVAEQLESWLKLVAGGEVHAVVQVDAEPQQIANRVRDLLIDAFVRHHEHNLVLRHTQCPQPGGYAALPNTTDTRFLIPLGNRKIAAASLAIYNAQRPAARAMKTLLQFGLRTGIVQPLVRHRANLGALADVPEFLSRTLGYDDISIAVSLGTPGPNQKPALQVMDRDGRILGYAKIGHTERTIASVRNEEGALRSLQRARFSTASIPQVLHGGWMGEQYVLVQSPATALSSTGRVAPGGKHACFLAELHRMNAVSGELPSAGETAIADLKVAGFHYYAQLIEWAALRFGGRVPFGPAHGDFTPWNIRQDPNGLVIFDWETFREYTPAGWDLFHLLVAGEVEIRGAAPSAIYAAIMNPGPTRDLIEDYFRRIGADVQLIEPLFVSYAANALSASALEVGGVADEKDLAMQRTWAALLMMTRYNSPSLASAACETRAVVETA